MPQLDLLTFFSQIIWLLITFITLYIVSARIIIPSISKSLITRRLLLKDKDVINSEGQSRELNSVYTLEKSLHSDLKTLKLIVSEIKDLNIGLQKKETNTVINQVINPITKASNEVTVRSKVTAFAYAKKAR